MTIQILLLLGSLTSVPNSRWTDGVHLHTWTWLAVLFYDAMRLSEITYTVIKKCIKKFDEYTKCKHENWHENSVTLA